MLATDTMSPSALARRAMIVSLSISQWSGRRLDRRVTDEVNASHNAAEDAGRYNKQLLDKAALAENTKIHSAARTSFAERTLPWVDDGSRIMSNHQHGQFTAWFNRTRREFDEAVDAFIAAYPAHVAEARKRLNGMFQADDYPSADELRGKFAMRVTIMPVPTGDDFRVSMSEAQADEIRAQIEESVRAATHTAVADVYKRIHDVAARMVERLGAYKPAAGPGGRAEGIFRDSLVGNVRDLVSLLPSLNVTGDPGLSAMADRLAPLAAFDAAVLREDKGKRADAAAAAQKILDDIGGFLA